MVNSSYGLITEKLQRRTLPSRGGGDKSCSEVSASLDTKQNTDSHTNNTVVLWGRERFAASASYY